ncbi:unnamed protein product, partial [Discosporangium mesarthrocarpum]
RARWERFEELLEEAQSTRDYDVTLAINQMADYLLSDRGAPIRQVLAVQLVDQVDRLGADTVTFLWKNIGQVRDARLFWFVFYPTPALPPPTPTLTPAMQSAVRVGNLLASSAGFDAAKV